MRIGWNRNTEAYEFETGTLLGQVSPFGVYHGLSGLMHRANPVNLVKPGRSFLNAEYYIRPGAGRRMLPRTIAQSARTTHELVDDSVAIHFPAEPEYRFTLDLTYRIREDGVDMDMVITPSMDIPEFEIFFASYVCEALVETFVPLRGRGGASAWTKLDNRVVMNSIFGVMRDASMRGLLPSAYPSMPVEVGKEPFHRPILAARDPACGLALVFMCDPSATKYLAGQYHGWDTAHDWSYGADLVADTPFRARTRLVCRPFPDITAMGEGIGGLWCAFDKG